MITTQADLETALLAGGEIHLDSGTPIALTASLEVAVPCRIFGGHLTRDSGPVFEVVTSGVEISGVRIDGGGTSEGYDATQKLIWVQGTAEQPIAGINVHDCELNGSRGDNIWLEWVHDSTIHHNRISHFLYSGIMVLSGVGNTVSGNVIVDAQLVEPVVNVYGIALTDLTDLAADRSRHNTVAGNHVELIDWEGIDTHGGEHNTITGNTVKACPRGVAMVSGNATRTLVPHHNTVSGNTIDAAGARQTLREAVSLAGISGDGASATITGNTITGYDTPYWTNYWSRADTYIGGNSVPHVGWSPVSMGADYTANGTYPLEYMLDGRTVHLRGGAIPKSGGTSVRDDVGSLPKQAAWPDQLTFVCWVKGSNPAAGSGMASVDELGKVRMWYGTGTDTYTYYLHGSYQAV